MKFSTTTFLLTSLASTISALPSLSLSHLHLHRDLPISLPNCLPGTPCSGPVTPQGPQTPNACGIQIDYTTEMGVAIPQWLFDLGRVGMQPSPLCGRTVTVQGTDGSTHDAKIVDRCGGGGGQDPTFWLDMSNPMYVAATGNPTTGSTGPAGDYPTVKWWVSS